jgi:hypothetical protein
MDRTLKRLTGLSMLAALLSLHVSAQVIVQSDDPIFGEWELDKSQSQFFGREVAPRSQTRIYEPDPGGIKSTIVTVLPNGDRTIAQFVSASDGVPSPFSGADAIDEITLERGGPYDAFVTLTNGAVDIGTAWRNISRDGKVLTIRMELGGNVASIRVYNKVED